MDARLFVDVSKLALDKTKELVLGDTSTGIDVDEFLRKCINWMKNSGNVDGEDRPQTQTQRRRTQQDPYDMPDDDDMEHAALDWEHLGRHACFPYNARPACRTFLLGPL